MAEVLNSLFTFLNHPYSVTKMHSGLSCLDELTFGSSSVCVCFLFACKALEPSDRKVLNNVTRWFLTCVNQPQFLQVLGKISLCDKMVPVTAKSGAPPKASATAAAAAAAAVVACNQAANANAAPNAANGAPDANGKGGPLPLWMQVSINALLAM